VEVLASPTVGWAGQMGKIIFVRCTSPTIAHIQSNIEGPYRFGDMPWPLVAPHHAAGYVERHMHV
jgi:hypothetical protein